MELKIFTDGGSLNNPGQAAYAFVFYLNNQPVYQIGVPIGFATNNDAEYNALINALKEVKKQLQAGTLKDITSISVFSDSMLMVSQVKGLWKIKHEPLRKYVQEVHSLELQLAIPISYTYVPREQNTLADSLVKKALGR